jgi:hypothetical protein
VRIVTVLGPDVPGGVTAVTVVELATTTPVAATPPIVTVLVSLRFVPVIVIGVPPAVGPAFGVTSEIVGGTMTYVNPFARFAVPPGVVSETGFAPAAPGGVTAVTVFGLTTVTELAALPPIDTALVPVRFVPVIVITVPPAVGPWIGLTDEIAGAATYVKPFARFAVPPGVVTDTALAPAVPEGVTAVTVVELTTVTLAAAMPPIETELVPVRFVPVIVITVPPAVEPWFGLTDDKVGDA